MTSTTTSTSPRSAVAPLAWFDGRMDSAPADAPSSLLLEVDFKWLMAGHGWWVDPIRFREDPAYAASCLASARATPSAALRQCAAALQARMARPRMAARHSLAHQTG